ncbi:MAG: type VI secretion system tube protein Hcp [Pseudomonadota bacterium]
MAVDIFIKVDGVKGESEDSKFKGEIDILAWSWGVSQSGTMHGGGGGGAGKANFQDISLTKWVDLSSNTLWHHCATGKHIPHATLIVRKAGEKPLEYLTYKMTDVLISSYSTGGSGGEDRLTENVSLNFAKIETVYKAQDSKGVDAGSNGKGFDIKKNVKV